MVQQGSLSLCAALDMVQSTVASVQPGLGTDVWQGLPGWGWAHGAVLLDPPPGWRHLTAPRLTGGSGIDAVAAGSWTALVSPIFERDLSLQGGSINPFWSRSQFSCQGSTFRAAQGLCKVFGHDYYLPVASARPWAMCQGLPGVGSMGASQGVSPCTSGVLPSKANPL